MKLVLTFVLLIVLFPFLFISSCTKTSADQLTNNSAGGGGTSCDTAQMKYSIDILPLLQAHCYSCHGNGNTGGSGGISLDGYINLKPYASSGVLQGNITHSTGFVGMPFGEPKMDDCTINKIIDWISQGSPDN
jgi:hypothetical protein